MSCKGNIKLLFAAFLVLLPVLTSAQTASLLEKFYSDVAGSCLEMTYSYSTRLSGVDNKGQGTLRSQGIMWELKGNGVEMFCDSKSIWIIDPSMKEVVIEPAPEDERQQWMSNPAVIFARLNELFKLTETLDSSDGKSVIYVLSPKAESDIDYCNLELFKRDATVRRASLALSDGTLIKIEVSSMKLTPELSVEAFRPQTVFDSSWILTDLR